MLTMLAPQEDLPPAEFSDERNKNAAFLCNHIHPGEPIMGSRKLLCSERQYFERMLVTGVFRMPYNPGTAHGTLVLDADTEIERVYYDSLLAEYMAKTKMK